MARARNIKPGFFMNEDLTEVAFEYRLLFIGLWTLADREGKLEDRPKRIKMELFPADDVDVDQGLTELERHGFLERYEANGISVVRVLKFTEHQRPHHTERASVLPNKDGSLPVTEPNKQGAKPRAQRKKDGELTVKGALSDGRNPPDSPNPDSLIPDSSNPEGKDSAPPAAQTGVPGKSKTKNLASLSVDDLKSEGVNEQVAVEFLALRKRKRAALTPLALEGIRREAGRADITLGDALLVCIERGWQSFRAEWVAKQTAGPPGATSAGNRRDRYAKDAEQIQAMARWADEQLRQGNIDAQFPRIEG